MEQKTFFITGTNTNIGKTIVSSLFCKALNADYYKPIQSGSITGDDDCRAVQNFTNFSDEKIHRPIYELKEPLSPHEAAKLEGITIDIDKLIIPNTRGNNLIIEGAGGVLVPINNKFLMIDLIKKMSVPVIIVASSGLGTINHTLLTIESIRKRKIEIYGVVLNGKPYPSNKKAIEFYGNVNVIAEIPWYEKDTNKKLRNFKFCDNLH